MNFHEDWKRSLEIRGGSNRNFGLVFAAFFLLVAAAPLRSDHPARLWALVPSLLFLAIALTRPSLLAPLNRQWTRLGLLLGRIVNPVVMAILYYAIFTPAGILLRAFGKDPLRLKAAAVDSYWIVRNPPGPPPESMSRQF